MADKRISELTTLTGANSADDDLLVIVDSSASETKSITLGELEKALGERDFSFADDDKLVFGDGDDLQIYHDGTDSYISNATGDLKLSGNTDISGTITADGLTVETSNPELRLIDTDAASGTYNLVSGNGASGRLILGADEGDTALASHIQLKVDGTQVARFDTGGDISFYEDTGATAKFFWDASAEKLGLGTTTPSHNIDVTSSQTASLRLESTTYNADFILYSGATGADKFGIYDNDASAYRLIIDNAGNVGIGTSSPVADLSVVDSATGNGIEIQPNVNTDVNRITNYNRSTNAYKVFRLDAERHDFYVSGSEAMRITSGGLMLINRTTPAGSSVPGLHISGSSDTSASNYTFYTVYNNNALAFGLRNDGYVRADGVYSKTNASAANVYVDASGLLQRSTSSLRYKTEVQDATHGLTEVMQLRPVTYKGINNGDTVFGGLIAEEVHDAGLTEFVQYAPDGSADALAYGNMVSLCIKAIQEQQAQIELLKARIETLEGN